MYKLHTSCRACSYAETSSVPPGIKAAPTTEKLIPVFDLGLQPLANDFCTEKEERAGLTPLEVLMCPRCKLAQLSVVVDPKLLYSKYSYVTSASQTMQEHFRSLWNNIKDRQPDAETVVEIGSNDGGLLCFLKELGIRVTGIDPAENLVSIAKERGVTSICGFFDDCTADMAVGSLGKVDVVIARHVFCHADNWRKFIQSLDVLCQRETLVAIEVPYVMDLLRNVQFDTIYHEHLSYLNIGAMDALLRDTVFRIDHIQHFSIHGGAIVIYLRRRDYENNADDSVQWYLDDETRRLNVEAWKLFEGKAMDNISQLDRLIAGLEGKTICGFGASAKSTVWLNALAPAVRDRIRFICDCTPQKQWKFSPGSRIPIVDEGALLRELPNYAIIFSWNFAREIMEKNRRYLDQGGKFIVPVPKVKVIECESA